MEDVEERVEGGATFLVIQTNHPKMRIYSLLIPPIFMVERLQHIFNRLTFLVSSVKTSLHLSFF